MVASTAPTHSVRKLKTYYIILVKSVALQGADDNGSLFNIFKVSEAEVYLLPIFGPTWRSSVVATYGVVKK